MKWYLKVLNSYADFSGRARRKEYWVSVLFNLLFSIAALMIDNLAGTTLGGLHYGLFYFLYAFAVLIPGLAVGVRRLHDVGKSGWTLLLAFIPIIGAIWLVVLLAMEGEAGDNPYGQNPKAVDANQ
jgi:uncharacterized membrane protein YhaH (DUF805 family)